MKRVAELEGVELSLWAGRADGADFRPDCNQGEYIITGGHSGITPEVYSPHEDWAQAGPLLEEYAIGFHPISDAEWQAEEHITCCTGRGPTPLIAAMRAFVASKFGDTVDEVGK